MAETPMKTIRLPEGDYPVDALGPEGQKVLQDYVFATTQLHHLRNMQAILNKARNAYIADLKYEIVQGRTGLDLSDLFSDD